jgi:hypothetical protein
MRRVLRWVCLPGRFAKVGATVGVYNCNWCRARHEPHGSKRNSCATKRTVIGVSFLTTFSRCHLRYILFSSEQGILRWSTSVSALTNVRNQAAKWRLSKRLTPKSIWRQCTASLDPAYVSAAQHSGRIII